MLVLDAEISTRESRHHKAMGMSLLSLPCMGDVRRLSFHPGAGAAMMPLMLIRRWAS